MNVCHWGNKLDVIYRSCENFLMTLMIHILRRINFNSCICDKNFLNLTNDTFFTQATYCSDKTPDSDSLQIVKLKPFTSGARFYFVPGVK